MSPDSTRFLEAVGVRTVAGGGDRFVARTQPVPWPKSYGGDLIGAAAAAMTRTVPAGRELHSLHGQFVRPVPVGAEVEYVVGRDRDGGSYSARHVRGLADGELAFTGFASFQRPEEGPDLQLEPIAGLPGPEELPSSAEALAGVPGEAAAYWREGRGFELRHVEAPLYLAAGGARVRQQAVWVRAFEALPDDPALHRIAIAYVCDYTILEPSLRLLGSSWSAPGLSTASLDHAIWFHRDARADDWLLYLQESVSVQRGRGLSRGAFWTRDGALVATVAQEGVLRLRPTPA